MRRVLEPALLKWSALLLFLLLCLITYLSLEQIRQFTVQADQLLHNTDDERGWITAGSGRVSFESNQIAINTSSVGNHLVYQKLDIETPAHVKLTFEAASSYLDISRGEYWYGASVFLKSLNKKAVATKVGYAVILDDRSDLKRYSFIESLGKDVQQIAVGIQISESYGDIKVVNPVLSKLKERSIYRYMKYLIIGLWVLAGTWVTVVLVNVLSIHYLVLFVVVTVPLLLGALLPEPIITYFSNGISALIPENYLGPEVFKVFGYDQPAIQSRWVSKLGHFIVFLLIGFVAGSIIRKAGLFFCIASIGVLALVTEVLQLLAISRSASLNDFYIDVTGGFIGVGVGALLCRSSASLKER